MTLKDVVPYLEAIMNAPKDPDAQVDAYLKFFYGNSLQKRAKGDNVWSELERLAHELERYDPNINFEARLLGFFGPERALTLTQRALDFIAISIKDGFIR